MIWRVETNSKNFIKKYLPQSYFTGDCGWGFCGCKIYYLSRKIQCYCHPFNKEVLCQGWVITYVWKMKEVNWLRCKYRKKLKNQSKTKMTNFINLSNKLIVCNISFSIIVYHKLIDTIYFIFCRITMNFSLNA